MGKYKKPRMFYLMKLVYDGLLLVITHWPLKDVDVILNYKFLNAIHCLIPWTRLVVLPPCEWHGAIWIIVNIGSNNDLVSSSNKPSPEPIDVDPDLCNNMASQGHNVPTTHQIAGFIVSGQLDCSHSKYCERFLQIIGVLTTHICFNWSPSV